jgi:hypothetical protein
MAESGSASHRTQILVAIIGAIAAVTVAVIQTCRKNDDGPLAGSTTTLARTAASTSTRLPSTTAPPPTTPPPSPSVIFRDDFDGATLKTGWTALPDGTRMSVHGGLLVIEAMDERHNRVRFDGSVLPADYQATLKVDKAPQPPRQFVRLAIVKDSDNYVAVEVGAFIFNSHDVLLAKMQSGDRSEAPAGLRNATSGIWLRLRKQGPIFSGAYSFDGDRWESLGKTMFNGLDGKLFVSAFNDPADASLPPPDAPISFDFFEIEQ